MNSIGLIYSKSGQWGKGVQKSKIVCGRHTSTIPDGDAPLKTTLLGVLLGEAESGRECHSSVLVLALVALLN